MTRVVHLALILVALSGSAAAQTAADCEREESRRRAEWEKAEHSWVANDLEKQFSEMSLSWCRARFNDSRQKIANYEDWGRVLFTGSGIHPVVGTIAPLNGLAAGATFGHEHNAIAKPLRMKSSIEGRFSSNGSWKAGGLFTLLGSSDRADNRHILASFDATHADVNRVNFFPLAGDSRATPSEFRFNETRTGISLEVPIPGSFSLVALGHGLWTDSSAVDSTGQIPTIPSASYFVYGGGVQWRFPSEDALSGYRTEVLATGQQFQDALGHQLSFFRSDVEWVHQYESQKLGAWSLVARLANVSASSGNAIPFYLQPTIGGGDIRGVNTLRGYQDYRFRAPSAVDISAEYALPLPRIEPLRLLLFGDAGQVADNLSSLRLDDVHTSYGLAVALRVAGNVFFQFTLGHGGEGTRGQFSGNSNRLSEPGTVRGVF